MSHRYRSPFALAGDTPTYKTCCSATPAASCFSQAHPAGEDKPELKLQFALAGSGGMQWVTVPPDCNVVAKDGTDGAVDIYRAKAVAPKQADGPLLATVKP